MSWVSLNFFGNECTASVKESGRLGVTIVGNGVFSSSCGLLAGAAGGGAIFGLGN